MIHKPINKIFNSHTELKYKIYNFFQFTDVNG
jgi:hypothetical protein